MRGPSHKKYIPYFMKGMSNTDLSLNVSKPLYKPKKFVLSFSSYTVMVIAIDMCIFDYIQFCLVENIIYEYGISSFLRIWFKLASCT